MAKKEIYVCDNCGVELGEAAWGNSIGGSYCSKACADTAGFYRKNLSQDPQSVYDILANLASRVTSLESQLRDTQGNVEKISAEVSNLFHEMQSPSPWATQEEVAEVNHRTYDLGRAVMDLEKRIQPKETPFFTSYIPRFYFNIDIDANADSAEVIVKRMINVLKEGSR